MNTLERKMLRQKNETSQEEAWQIAEKADCAVLATVSEDGWPYAVSLTAMVINQTFYFHTAKRGHKYDNFLWNDKCCLTGSLLVNNDREYSYESYVAYGRIRLVENQEEKLSAYRYLLNRWDRKEDVLEQTIDRADWWAVDVEKITGKVNTHSKKQ